MKTRLPLAALAAVSLLAACDDGEAVLAPQPATEFEATLTGAAERPNPVSPSGSGTATFTLNDAGTAVSYSITVQNMTSAISAAHIHLGDASVSGGVVVALTTPTNGGTVTGSVSSTTGLGLGVSFGSLLELMRNGDVYVNVHTANNPGGEIRGQIEPTD